MGLGDRIAHAWNAFIERDKNRDEFIQPMMNHMVYPSYGFRPDRNTVRIGNERTIIASIYTTIAIDASDTPFRHVRLDETGRFKSEVKSGLQQIFSSEANIDQAARAFRQDMVHTLVERGHIAVIPIDTTIDPSNSGMYEIQTMRVGEVKTWYPEHVLVDVYNEKTGKREEVYVEKKYAALIENPFYSVMNEPNSTLQRLLRKLGMLDSVDEQSSSGKLDLIIQLPYVIKSEARRQQADQRRKDIEFQLKGSQYGIAYTDGTEKITQLNRPAENNLMKQVEYLTSLLYAQLGLTEEIINGTASEATMINYRHRTLKPILDAIAEEFKRKFLTKTARTQGQTITYVQNPFTLTPVSLIADIADKFTRNEILTSNEVREIVGFAPSSDAKADELRNSNMPVQDQGGIPA